MVHAIPSLALRPQISRQRLDMKKHSSEPTKDPTRSVELRLVRVLHHGTTAA